MPYEISRVNEPQNVAKEFLCEIVETLDVKLWMLIIAKLFDGKL